MIYYIYPIPDQKTLDKFRNYHEISDNPENRDLCIYRERWLEIEYFTKTGNCLFYADKKFTTPSFEEITPTGIFIPRMDIRQYEKYLIEQKSILTIDQYQKICHWFHHINEIYTKRKIIIAEKDDLEKNFDNYYDQVKDFKGRFFIKSVNKDWSFAGHYDGWIDSGAAFSINHGGAKELCLLSEFVEIKEDDYPSLTVEYRCFYILGKLKSISRYGDYQNHEIPDDILEYAKKLESEIVGKLLPHTVVIDVADTNRGLIFLEANDVCSSGRYVNNKLETFPL